MVTLTKKFTTVEAAREAYVGGAAGSIAVAAQAKTEAAAMKAAAKAGKPEPKHPALDVITEASTLRKQGGKLRSKKASSKGIVTATTTTATGRLAPGALGIAVAEFMATNGGEFTPTQIAAALGRSAGAVSNALDRLVAIGSLKRVSQKPRRYATVAQPAAKSAASKRDVTPIPKKAPARKRTSKSAAA